MHERLCTTYTVKVVFYVPLLFYAYKNLRLLINLTNRQTIILALL